MNLRSYLEAKSYEFKESAGQDVSRTCPFCEDEKWHFYIDPEKNLYFCHKCNAKGNEKTLRRRFNDVDNPNLTSFREAIGKKESKKPPQDKAEQFHRALFEHQHAFDYLIKRGLKMDTITHFKLGYMKDNKGEWLAIPYYDNGELINFKYRLLPPGKKDFKREFGAKSALFNQDCLKDCKEVIITEGEFDAIMCWQAGHTNVISGSNGCASFEPEWIDQLENVDKIYLWYDNDEKGNKAADELGARLGVDRCYFIKEEGYKDANEYFICNESYDLSQGIQKKIDNVIHFWDSVFKIFEHEKELTSDIKTPWDNVDKLLGNIEAGDLIILSAVPKTGKTTMALNIATHNAKRGFPVLVYCLEMRPERLAKKVIESEGLFSKGTFTRDKALATAERLLNVPLYFGYNYKNINPETVFQTIRAATRRFGLKLIVFDNLHYLVRSVAHVSAEVGNVTRAFKLLAEELHIPLILIAQPRKVEDGAIMTMNDLKDSSSIGADSDQVIILWRKKTKSNPSNMKEQEASFEPKTLVRVDASRYTAGGDTLLYFKGEHSQFAKFERGPHGY